MAVILQVDFPSQGPFGEEMSQMYQALAESINQEPGLIWKIWTEHRDTQHAGGIYLFDHEQHAQQYLKMHTERLEHLGIQNIRGQIFHVNPALCQINHADFVNHDE
ncbi:MULTISPECIES: monooxygenase [unclassified Acinetobacter]|uniref:monooxygenase n=1 Tax=unclassified Acinetobacter TaxID=196816 RepID=UPI002934372A|nr:MULTISPECIES: monooxygenase [unclassified Acinetobacter]WOE31114.1 monooxygenase [Acinetobacter sp. SAAs470]WOE39310.1 monooxygenase [Acinetobacter sp. SAAs474]